MAANLTIGFIKIVITKHFYHRHIHAMIVFVLHLKSAQKNSS